MKAFLWLLILFALGGTSAAHAGHDHYRGGHLALWLGVPPPIVAPGHLHGYFEAVCRQIGERIGFGHAVGQGINPRAR